MKKQKGFTLIELLVVIAIIGLLSTLAVVSFGNVRQRARDAKRVSDMKSLHTALEFRFSDIANYPGELLTGADSENEIGFDITSLLNDGWNGSVAPTYMGVIPRDPSDPVALCANTGGSACATPCRPFYSQISTVDYFIVFCLEGNTGDLDAGRNCVSPEGLVSVGTSACT